MKKAAFYLLALTLTLAVTTALAEVLLRVNGFKPWTTFTKDANEPTVHEPHPVYGWRNREGEHVVPAYAAGAEDIEYTFLARGLRSTGPAAPHPEGAIILVGGSYTQGWAVSDRETWGWKLQERFPTRPVLNWGTAGYGTYQALLVLEHELPRLSSPAIVVYAFVDHHELRNVAPARWLRTLSRFSRRGHVEAPYATLDARGDLVGHPPEGYLALPLHGSLATVAFVERLLMDRRARSRSSQGPPVTERVLSRMSDLCREHGAALVVVVLRAKPVVRSRLRTFLESEGIPWMDCSVPLTPDHRVPGEGHPNGRAHSKWADCIAPVLADLAAATGEGAAPGEALRP